MHGEEADADERSTMTAQIVITEKSSQAKDVRAAVGSRYGAILAAEGHLLDLCEPGEVNPAWKRWSAVLLKPDGLYVAKPATEATRRPSSRASARRCALPAGCGSPPTTIERDSSSGRRSSSIAATGRRR